RSGRSATREENRGTVVGVGEIEIELERIVLSEVRRESAVFEAVVEHAEPAAHDEFVGRLISETDTRGEVGVLGIAQTLSVLVGDGKGDAVLGEQVGEAGRATARKVVGVRSFRNDVEGTTSWGATRHEVGLVAVMLEHQSEKVVANTEVNGQFVCDFPVV